MSLKVAIIDYGLGNLFSIRQACENVGLRPLITSNEKTISKSDAIILPGVGAFGHAMKCLENNNLTDPLIEFAKSGKPFMGICLGMQLLFSNSEEFGLNKGLNIIEGSIKKFPINHNGNEIKLPQIQWNKIMKNDSTVWNNSPLKKIKNGTHMYFVHSFYCEPKNKSNIISYTNYMGFKYASAVKKGNIIGFQFHPEKSSIQGLNIYSSWANIIKKQ